MIRKLFFAVFAASVCVLPASSKILRGFCTSTDGGAPTLIIDSIDVRKDLVRVYGKFTGTPHTSSKVDRIKMAADGTVLESTDIDGVDFGRYFQWEDDGVIPVEIDFPTLRKFPASGTIEMSTPRGPVVTTWKHTPACKHKHKAHRR